MTSAQFTLGPGDLPGGNGSEEGDGGLDLPVNPDQGIPLAPDDDGAVTVPT